jgi:DNA-binding NarL/FixJ family response regulator
MGEVDGDSVGHSSPVGGTLGVLPARRLRLALVDSDPAVHLAVKGMVEEHPLRWVVESYHDAPRALAAIPAAPPHVVLMAAAHRGLCGFEAARRLAEVTPSLRVLMLAGECGAEFVRQAVEAGTSGCLVKPITPSQLISVVEGAAAGAVVFCDRSGPVLRECLARCYAARPKAERLTRREREVVDCLGERLCDKEIAERLRVELSTVHTFIRRIFRKWGVHKRSEAVEIFRRVG